MSGLDSPLGELDGDAADLLDRPADQDRRFFARRGGVFFERHGIGLVTDGSHHGEGKHDQRDVRCQPCQERVSL